MRSVEEQLAIVTDAAVIPEPVRMSIGDALGLMAAEEVQATVPVPGFALAAVDGYAVRAVDIGGERALGRGIEADHPDAQGADLTPSQPVMTLPERSLPVVGEVPAGSRQPLRLQPKQAVRVHTGAPLPTLADAVLPLEWSDRGRKRVTAQRPVRSGDFVRRAGDDMQPGDVAVGAGTVLGPAQIGLLAAAGRSKVLVYPRPRVAVLSYGHELVDIDRSPGHGQVFDIASYAVAAAAKEAGAEVNHIGIAAGEPRRLREIIETQLQRSELLIVLGAVGGQGAAVLRGLLEEFGDVDTTRVAMHPGSVQGFGLLGPGRIPALLLPNNPVSSLVAFEVFGRPLLRTSLGKKTIHRRLVRARCINHVSSIEGRRGYVRARLMRDAETQDYLVEGLGGATGAPAHLLAGLAEANAMIRVPEAVSEIRPGDIVDVLFVAQRW
ncbi:molybdotransferase-like divisome protein Glp [Corynebacterium uterequi]|uniref:Molybdopterin molybdenumtransferase n=1 Tax=Corynebacterium uterequi TaxID=1072256 RepID=A0A0G3HBQ3_9CORY|nr:gephyrin-like molybdotransferase Glp [Corynebacterium uterequi]AKK10704.1 molybdopterin biosynthesis enzyme [Corynebacterium uterequi]